MKFRKLVLNTANEPTITEQSIGQALVTSLTSPLDLISGEDNEFVSKAQAGMNTVVGFAAGALIQAFFPFVPFGPNA